MPRAHSDPIQAIRALFDQHGAMVYGERVNQIRHALQCGMLAERAGATPELVTASFLHDIGHMLHHDPAGALASDVDDRHERLGAKYLASRFVPAEADRFAARPGFADAIALRRWDEQGKDPAIGTPDLEHFLRIAGTCLAS